MELRRVRGVSWKAAVLGKISQHQFNFYIFLYDFVASIYGHNKKQNK
jgi:hypothetical protein